MLTVGIIDNDQSLVETLTGFWREEFNVRLIEPASTDLQSVDVVVADPQTLNGHVRRFVRELRTQCPRAALVFTYVYCDVTQPMEDEVFGMADACVVKPYDLQKLGQTIRWVAEQQGGPAPH